MGLDDLVEKENQNLKFEILNKLEGDKDLYQRAEYILEKNGSFFADKYKAFCANKLVSEFVFEDEYKPKFLTSKQYKEIISNYGVNNEKE